MTTVAVALRKHLAEDVAEDAAVLVVGDFEGRIDASDSGNVARFAVCFADANADDRYYADFELLILEIAKRINSSLDTPTNTPTNAVVQ